MSIYVLQQKLPYYAGKLPFSQSCMFSFSLIAFSYHKYTFKVLLLIGGRPASNFGLSQVLQAYALL